MPKYFRGVGMYLLVFLVIILIASMTSNQFEAAEELSYNVLLEKIEAGEVDGDLVAVGDEVQGTLVDGTNVTASIPDFDKDYYDSLNLEGSDVNLVVRQPQGDPLWLTILSPLLMVGFFAVIWYLFMRQSQGGGGKGAMNFGKSKARMVESGSTNVSFADVAGLEEEKEELAEIVDFLSHPKRYIQLGARIPKGILMIGPPGTGKTYLSKAVAGEAGVPFFSISGSDFVEMFVGVGASRVRDLFEQAKKNSPCIIFIDEIDAVGRRRGAGVGGGHDEREQTLNQLLVEMDGFGVNEGVIVMAATNRPDILDPAILRPGRFDRQVRVGIPDIKGREAILKVHCRNKPMHKDINLKTLAKRTIGFTPADLENLLNEAALLSARENLLEIPMRVAEEAITKVIAGPEKKSHVRSAEENRLVAFHEAGHAVVSQYLSHVDKVHMVTIMPRGSAGGFTMHLPDKDKRFISKRDMEEQLVVLLGGRVAEELVLDDISTGASNDIERVTATARAMVTHYGMNDEMGPMTYGKESNEVFLGRDIARSQDYSDETASKIDKEMRQIVDEAYRICRQLLTDHMDKVHAVADLLLEKETITADEFSAIFNEGEALPVASATEAKPEKKELKVEGSNQDPIGDPAFTTAMEIDEE
ncbi:ATP-dependent zinc metalloprotease FtsH [Gottschalkiaceae bacterium SANA]|nr:ATP-dependent zinc metalloprotease FtsH [Gottschalkiaceae bacterium SANA]